MAAKYSSSDKLSGTLLWYFYFIVSYNKWYNTTQVYNSYVKY